MTSAHAQDVAGNDPMVTFVIAPRPTPHAAAGRSARRVRCGGSGLVVSRSLGFAHARRFPQASAACPGTIRLPDEVRVFEVASLACFAVFFITFAFRILAEVSERFALEVMGGVVAVCVLAFVTADFLSGLVHFLCDNLGSPDYRRHALSGWERRKPGSLPAQGIALRGPRSHTR